MEMTKKEFYEFLEREGVRSNFDVNLKAFADLMEISVKQQTDYMMAQAQLDKTSPLVYAFSWSDTPEGGLFWANLAYKHILTENIWI